MSDAGSIHNNLRKSTDAIRTAAEVGADLILFPEVQLTEFFPRTRVADVSKYKVRIDSDIVTEFCTACMENHIMAVPNIYLEQDGKCYDASIMMGKNGEIIGVQKMVHIAQADNFYEQDYYTPADDGFHVFETECGRIGTVVCFDRHYPESIRTEALMGAELILIPTVNTKSEPMEMFEWELRVQAFQSSVAIAMCNRVGTEGKMEFSGESVAVNADGNVIVKADDTEQIVYADIYMQESDIIRQKRPYTSLRRTEYYK